MIFYFSGTGNSKWAAGQLASLTGDKTTDITDVDGILDIQAEKQIGFVFPVYAWGAPEPVVMFAKKLAHFKGFTFGVCTCGGNAGRTMKRFSQIYPLDSSYSLIMPNNYIIGTDTEDEKVISDKITAAGEELQRIAQEIVQKKNIYRVCEGGMAGVKSGLVNAGFNKFARSARPFYAENTCNGCGLCVKNCPASIIRMEEGKPVWGEKCFQCMRCINECPRQAIQYGKSTKGRRRYSIRRYVAQDNDGRFI